MVETNFGQFVVVVVDVQSFVVWSFVVKSSVVKGFVVETLRPIGG